MPGDTTAESQDGHAGPVRRSGRQAKRTDKLEEFLLTTKRTRTVGRRSAPGSVEGGDPPSQTHTDAETASEASFDGNTEAKSVEGKPDSPVRKTSRKRTTRNSKGRGSCRGGSVSDDGSSDNEEKGSGDAPKEPQPQPQEEKEEDKKTIIPEKKEEEDTVQPQPEQDSVKKEVSEKEEEEDEKEVNEKEESEEKPVETSGRHASRSSSPAKAASRGTNPNKRDTKSRGGAKTRKDKEEEDDDEYPSSSSSSDSGDAEGYDPNALYCICRQKHNKRFMICCDRCEEWFHGDCVGITEARGRLMERNGEDYVCPNCTTKKSQTAKPNGKPKAAAPGALKAEQSPSVAAPSPTASAGAEEKGDDLGIKGRIEKTTNPSGKKKIKIFQAAAEESKLPKCIGPGCEKTALKDSVYCGSECILRHAAAAMAAKSISEPKQKDQDKAKGQKKTPGARATTKKSSTGRKTSKKSTEEESDSEDDKKDGDEEQNAVQQPPPPTMSSWSSDHNYNAVTPEKTTPIAPPTVLNKTCMYLFEGLNNPLLNILSSHTIGVVK